MARPVNVRVSQPSGFCVCIWSGSLETIPAGWRLCDGTNGTPDLRDKFVVGMDFDYFDPAHPEWETWDEQPCDLRHGHSDLDSDAEAGPGHQHYLTNRSTTTWAGDYNNVRGKVQWPPGGYTHWGAAHAHSIANFYTSLPNILHNHNWWGSSDIYGSAAVPLYPPWHALHYIMGEGIPPYATLIGWWGSESEVPADYYPCNGVYYTPDITGEEYLWWGWGRMIFGAGGDLAFNDVGDEHYLWVDAGASTSYDHQHDQSPLAMIAGGNHVHRNDDPQWWFYSGYTTAGGNGGGNIGCVAANHRHQADLNIWNNANDDQVQHSHVFALGPYTWDGSDYGSYWNPPQVGLIWLMNFHLEGRRDDGLPIGCIIPYPYDDLPEDLPTGWAYCDGTQGTPDLRGRTVVGAGSTFEQGTSGGSAVYTLPAHTHDLDPEDPYRTMGAHGDHTHEVSLTTQENAGTETSNALDPSGSVATFDGSLHTHTIADVYNDAASGRHTHELTGSLGWSQETDVPALPPYLVLHYIMRIA